MTEERTQYTVHPDIAIRLETSERYIAQMENTLNGYAMVQGRHAETITAQAARIAELEQANRDLNTMLQVAVAAQRAVPVDAMRVICANSMYDAQVGGMTGYDVAHFINARDELIAWLDGDA